MPRITPALSWLFALTALVGCVGDPCDVDSDCISNSCTWGSCDSVLLNVGKNDGDAPEDDEPEPERVPSCQDRTSCEWLLSFECDQQPGCGTVTLCTTPISCFGSDCPVCETRASGECAPGCEPFFLECERTVECSGLSAASCKAEPACVYR